MSTELILWRHGETEWNRETRFQGQADVQLNALGEMQAKAAAIKLAAYEPQVIISSDLSRARKTAETLADRTGVKVAVDKRLREIDVGTWSGLTLDEVTAEFPDYRRLIHEHIDFPRSPTGETLTQVGVRIGEALLDIASQHRGKRVVVASHGNALRVGLAYVLGWSWETLGAMVVPGNAHWAVLHQRRDTWRLVAYNVGAAGPSSFV